VKLTIGSGRSPSAVVRGLASLLVLVLVAAAVTRESHAAARPDKHESKAPSASTKGEVFEWKGANGIPYEYFVPKSYDAKVGANLVVVLHGNGLDYHWTFLNHPAGQFRPDDVVVSLEGPDYFPSTKAFEFGEGRAPCEKVHAVLEELKKAFKVKQTFLYGHSQGSFFVFTYAGEFPDDVNGVVGHSGALWASSKLSSAGHKLAIGLMHGTDDANVHWFQSVDARKAYRDANYPNVHLRTLWNHPHAPVWQQAENELAWCEGTTSDDPARVAAALATLTKKDVPYGVDFAALSSVATRLESMNSATPAQKSAATRAKTAVDALAKKVAAAVDRELGKGKLTKVDGKPWLGLALAFLEDFDGVPSCVAWSKTHAADLTAIDKVASDASRDYRQAAGKEPGKASAAAMDVLEKGWRNAAATDFAAELEKLLASEKSSGLSKKEYARAKALLESWTKARKEGIEACAKLEKEFEAN
jgi:predicted esterase